MTGKLQQEQISESDWKDDFRVSMKSFYELLMYKIIMTEFSGGGNIQDQSSSAINGLLHVSQLRINLVH